MAQDVAYLDICLKGTWKESVFGVVGRIFDKC